MNKLAQIPLSPPGGFKGKGALGLENSSPNQAPFLFASTLSKIIGVMTAVAFIWFAIQLVLGGVRWVTSGGDKNAVESARKSITNGLIGLTVTVAAIFLLYLISTILNIESLRDPAQFILNLI